MSDDEKDILSGLNTNGDNPNADDESIEKVPSNIMAGTVVYLSNALSDMVHPCWKLKDDEAKAIVDTMDAAYPSVDIGKYAKAFFWLNITLIFLPRIITTVNDYLDKLKKKQNEINTNIG